MAMAPDGRLFVAEQGGKLRVVKNGSLLSSSFVTVTTINDASEVRNFCSIFGMIATTTTQMQQLLGPGLKWQ